MPSTVVADFFYDAKASSLKIIFDSGKIYDYKNVPEKIYNDMKSSFSKGIYFNRYIKDKFDFEKIEGEIGV